MSSATAYQITPDRLAVSTWSLHRRLGLFYHDRAEERVAEPRWGTGDVSLIDLVGEIAAHGIHQIEICHFQIPDRGRSYLDDLKSALAEQSVRCLTLLMDAGDITHPDAAQRETDLAMIEDWIGIAGILGAERIRVIAGMAMPDDGGDALRLCVDGLRRLNATGEDRGVRIVIENWHALLERPREVLEVLDRMEGDVGLLADFGNWPAPRKFDDLPFILPRAESTHAKAYFPNGKLDTADYGRCLDLCRAAGFTGPHSLIFDSETPSEWEGIEEIKRFVLSYPGNS